MHEEWKGGNMELYPGGGHKLNLLRKEIELVKNETDLVVMFTDRYLTHQTITQTTCDCKIFKWFLVYGILT